MKTTKKPVFAKKSLGQNFLVDENFISSIVDALEITPEETIIEIGPGRGALTGELLERGAKVVAIEFDRDMTAILKDRFDETSQLELVRRDALSVDFATLLGANLTGTRVKLVANLPYNISTAILQRLIGQRHLFSLLVLMLQREVVERLTAVPGKSDRGFLTVLAEAAFKIDRLFDVPPDAFRPRPRVWSSVVRLTPQGTSVFDELRARDLISKAFLQKRKTLLNNLKSFTSQPTEIIQRANLDPSHRPETLTIADWESLINAYDEITTLGK